MDEMSLSKRNPTGRHNYLLIWKNNISVSYIFYPAKRLQTNFELCKYAQLLAVLEDLERCYAI